MKKKIRERKRKEKKKRERTKFVWGEAVFGTAVENFTEEGHEVKEDVVVDGTEVAKELLALTEASTGFDAAVVHRERDHGLHQTLQEPDQRLSHRVDASCVIVQWYSCVETLPDRIHLWRYSWLQKQVHLQTKQKGIRKRWKDEKKKKEGLTVSMPFL